MTDLPVHGRPNSLPGDGTASADDLPAEGWETRLKLARDLLSRGNGDEALALLSQLAAERPDDYDIQRELLAAYTGGRGAVDPSVDPLDTDPEIEAMNRLAEGRRHQVSGAFAEAEADYRAALALTPGLASARLQLARVLLATHRSDEAIATARQVLRADADNAEAQQILGDALLNQGKAHPAMTAYTRAIALKPELAAARLKLGMILHKLGRSLEAVYHVERAASETNNAGAYIELATILTDLRDTARAREALIRARDLQPVVIYRAQGGHTDFSALMVWGPGRANTPVSYLTEQETYERRMLTVLDGSELTPDSPAARGDVIVNLLADADQASDLLPIVARALDRFDAPIINHPRKIISTDRDTIASRLSGIPGCQVPRVIRCNSARLIAETRAGDVMGLAYPLLLRTAGTHGGDALDCIDTKYAVSVFVARHQADVYYATAFVDYRSADGYFRKYRLVFVDGVIFPYHLAIGDQWKVHHYRTQMAKNPWMQKEEEKFLAQPDSVLTPTHWAALRQINDIVGLDFFGIDCAIDRDGNLLVFEVNACMLIEPDDSQYAFKLPYNAAIKRAFHDMLARAAAKPRTQGIP